MSAAHTTNVKTPQRDDHVQRQGWKETVHVLEATGLDLATTFKNLEIQLDHPTLFVVVDDRLEATLRGTRRTR